MKTYKEYIDMGMTTSNVGALISPKTLKEKKSKKDVGIELVRRSGKIGGQEKRDPKRFDKYDKGSPKTKRNIIQQELDYMKRNYSKKSDDELLDDLDDKFSYSTDTYKKGSIKIVNGKVK